MNFIKKYGRFVSLFKKIAIFASINCAYACRKLPDIGPFPIIKNSI